MLVSPEERFVRLRIEPEQAARLAHRLTGGTTGGEPEGDLLPILETFAQQGLLADRPAAVSPLTGRHVLVRGGGPVAATVTRLLRAAGVGRVTERDAGALPVSTVDAPHAVIACAGWLPDADWLRLDAWCAGHGIVWTGCHAEGLRFHL
ncbi:MAG TPA: hypothetical protein DD490_18240, partial [Acidobacteria bacterium]|nr:hypothetical protein [Acidobacteriota bacterium]